MEAIIDAPTIEPNLVINPEEVTEGRVIEIGEDIVVMHHKDYYDMFLKSELYDDIKPCEDVISIEVAIQTTWMILNGMGYPKDQNEELDQTIKDVFATAPRVLPNHSGEATEMVEDAISREAAIEALKSTPREELEWDSGEETLRELPSVVPSRPKGEWIPCSERLPSDGELCLVSVIMDDAPYEIIISDSVTYCYERGWANAWMPLPKPWKGADDE